MQGLIGKEYESIKSPMVSHLSRNFSLSQYPQHCRIWYIYLKQMRMSRGKRKLKRRLAGGNEAEEVQTRDADFDKNCFKSEKFQSL